MNGIPIVFIDDSKELLEVIKQVGLRHLLSHRVPIWPVQKRHLQCKLEAKEAFHYVKLFALAA
jgi:methionine salvage enolase-phosphatase E1